MEHINNNILAVFAVALLLFSLITQIMLYQEVEKVQQKQLPITGKAVTGAGSVSLTVRYPFIGAGFTAEVMDYNKSVLLKWTKDSGDNYTIHVADNASQDFYLLVDALTVFNYTDSNASNYTERYYNLERHENGISENATKIVGKYDISISTDNGRWNYVSLPVLPLNTSVTDVLKTMDGKYEWIYEYVAATSSFKFWFSGFGTITDLTPGKCFIIQPYVNATFTVAGDDYSFINETLLTNDGRWNYIGWLNENVTVAVGTASIAGNFDWIYEYITSTGAFNFFFGGGGTITNLQPSRCYIIQPTINNSILTYTK